MAAEIPSWQAQQQIEGLETKLRDQILIQRLEEMYIWRKWFMAEVVVIAFNCMIISYQYISLLLLPTQYFLSVYSDISNISECGDLQRLADIKFYFRYFLSPG